MIYVTGDTHGQLSRFKQGKLRWLGKKDTVIVLGDFGFLWNDSKAEQAARRWLQKRRYTLLFIDGCHENFALLDALPRQEKFGGTVCPVGGNLYYVPRGQLLSLEEKTLLCFGGGESPDKLERTPGENWWPQEAPTQAEMEACDARLAQAGGRVDYILTHDAPERLLGFAHRTAEQTTPLNRYFDGLLTRLHYRRWLFGCYHRDMTLSPKAQCVFDGLVPLAEK